MIEHLALQRADQADLQWAHRQVTLRHYLHHPVDARCRPLAYLVRRDGLPPGAAR